MPYVQAVAKLTNGNGKVITKSSNILNVDKYVPLNEWIIRVESGPINSGTFTNRTHFELNEPIVVPHNSFVQVFPILRSEINKTQTENGLHLAAFRFTDTLVNGRSVKTIADNEVVGTWKFVSNLLNVVSILTEGSSYGSSPLNAEFNYYGLIIPCTIYRSGTVVVNPTYTVGYYNAVSGGSITKASKSTDTKYLRFKLDKIMAGTVLTLRAGSHDTPRNDYYTDFTVIQAGDAIDSSNGVKTRMYGDGSPNREITLTFNKTVNSPVEFVIGVNIWNAIYRMDKYSTKCTNYVSLNGKDIVAAELMLHWGLGY